MRSIKCCDLGKIGLEDLCRFIDVLQDGKILWTVDMLCAEIGFEIVCACGTR